MGYVYTTGDALRHRLRANVTVHSPCIHCSITVSR
jgi:hypothetical protein